MGTGAIVGIVAGVVVVLALIAGLLFRNKRNKRRGEEVHKAELYQQQRMMNDNSSVLASGRVPHHQRFNSSSGLATAAVVTAGAGSRNGGSVGVGKRGMGGKGDRESLSEDYRQQQEQYHQQQPDWFAKKSPLEYYSQVPPVEQLVRGVGRKASDNSLNGGIGGMSSVGDKDEIELQHAGPSMSSSAPGQGHSEIMAARSLQASTMQHNLQQQHLQQQQQQQLQQNPFQAQQQKQQQYGRESTSLNPSDAGRYNEPAMVIPRQQPTRQQQQQQQQQLREHSRTESNSLHSGHLPPIQMHSPMGSVYQDPSQTPTNSSYHSVPMPSRPNSFYNVGNILNAADNYAEVDMTSYYRPPPPAALSTPSGFYDFDVASDSNNNDPPMLPTNGSSFTGDTGIGAGVPERPVGVASPPPIPRATRPASLSPTSKTANNNGNSRVVTPPTPTHTYLPPPLPTVSTTTFPLPSQSAEGSFSQSPVSPTSGPLVGGRTPRSIHGSGVRRV